jgi:hypothetical protein
MLAYQNVMSVMVSVTALTTVTNSTASATLSLSSDAALASVLTRVNFAMVPQIATTTAMKLTVFH